MRCSIIPPYLLLRLADAGHDAGARTLLTDDRIRAARGPGGGVLATAPVAAAADVAAWTVHDAGNTEELPGRKVRAAGEPTSDDAAVDEAAEGISGSLALFAEVYERDSYDGKGAPVSLSVHYGRDYDNAFWDGTQLVFGDGDGRVFGRFTKAIDVLAHEFTHAVTEHTAGLVYQGQSGALNESVSDVFAACLEQRLKGQDASDADWLIGSELFLPGISARGLRDMKAPGTAYDDPALGKDPQPGHMDDYVDTTDDNGGVHVNSGIPNRAFHLAAVGVGGPAWEGAGRIWFRALTGGDVRPDTDFAGFARATIAAAGEQADAVRGAWRGVGVEPAGGAGDGGGSDRPGQADQGGGRQVRVRRTGGFAGQTVEGGADLDADDRGPELAGLLDRIDLATVAATPAQPDRFVYEFDLAGERVTLREQDLTDDLRRVADLVLRAD